MSDIIKCPKCHIPMVWKSGINKTTGKSYGFWGCPNFPACRESYSVSKPTAGEEKFQRELEEDKIYQRVKEKRDNIAWLNAKTNAIALLSHSAFATLTAKEIEKKLPLLISWLYKLTLEKSEIEIEEQKAENSNEDIERELEEITEDDFNEEEIDIKDPNSTGFIPDSTGFIPASNKTYFRSKC